MKRVIEYVKSIRGTKTRHDPNTMTIRDIDLLISLWKLRAEKGNVEEAISVANEARPFFETMQKRNPTLYDLFRSQHKSLVETMFEKILGQEATIE